MPTFRHERLLDGVVLRDDHRRHRHEQCVDWTVFLGHLMHVNVDVGPIDLNQFMHESAKQCLPGRSFRTAEPGKVL